MTASELAVLLAACAGGAVIERYTGRARASVTGQPLSAAEIHRLVRHGLLERKVLVSLDFHFDSTERGRAKLRSHVGQLADLESEEQG